MAKRLYIMPIYDNGDFRFPKYCYVPGQPELSHVDAVVTEGGTGYKMMPFGMEDAAIVSVNCTNAEHTAIAAMSDTRQIPEDINTNPTTNGINNISPFLESIGFPSNWINTSLTYKQILKRLVAFCQISQEYKSRFKTKIFESGEGLDTILSNLSTNKRNRLKEIYDNKNIEYPANTDTLRDVLNTLTLNYVTNKGKTLGNVDLGGFVV